MATLLCAAALGCQPHAAGLDAGVDAAADATADATADAYVDPECEGLLEGMSCDHRLLDSRASCQGGRCLPGCEGDPNRTPCTSEWGLGTECCSVEQRCCFVAHGKLGCRPGDLPCPHLCAFHTPVQWECTADMFCAYEYLYAQSMPPDGTCPDAISNAWWTGRTCVADCPAAQRCRDDCCGLNTRCDEASGCCVASRWDVSDAGAGDAGGSTDGG